MSSQRYDSHNSEHEHLSGSMSTENSMSTRGSMKQRDKTSHKKRGKSKKSMVLPRHDNDSCYRKQWYNCTPSRLDHLKAYRNNPIENSGMYSFDDNRTKSLIYKVLCLIFMWPVYVPYVVMKDIMGTSIPQLNPPVLRSPARHYQVDNDGYTYNYRYPYYS